MSQNIGKLLLQIQVDGQGQLKTAQTSMQGLEKAADKTKTSLLATSIAIGGVTMAIRMMVQGISKWVEYAAQQELAATALTSALNGIGSTSKEVETALTNQASALQRASAYGDEAITQTQALLATYGRTTKEIREMTPVLVDLASKMSLNSGRTVSLETATRAYFRVLDGQDRALKPYGIQLSEIALQSKDATKITQELRQVVAGAGQDFANTTTGQLTQYSNALNDLKEVWGAFFIETFRPQIEGLTALFQMLAPKTLPAELDEVSKSLTKFMDIRDEFVFKGSGQLGKLNEEYKNIYNYNLMTDQVILSTLQNIKKMQQQGTVYVGQGDIEQIDKMIEKVKAYTAATDDAIKKDEERQEAERKKKTSQEKNIELQKEQMKLDELRRQLDREDIQAIDELEEKTLRNIEDRAYMITTPLEKMKTTLIDVNALLTTTDDMFRNHLAQSAGDFLTGEKVQFGAGLKRVLREIIVQLTVMLLKSLSIKAVFAALGIISGGASQAVSAGGAVGGAAGGAGVGSILNSMPQIPGGLITAKAPGTPATINTVTNIFVETLPLTSDYEKTKAAGEYYDKYRKISERGTL